MLEMFSTHLLTMSRPLLVSRVCVALLLSAGQRPERLSRQSLSAAPLLADSQDAMRLPSAPTPPDMSQPLLG